MDMIEVFEEASENKLEVIGVMCGTMELQFGKLKFLTEMEDGIALGTPGGFNKLL